MSRLAKLIRRRVNHPRSLADMLIIGQAGGVLACVVVSRSVWPTGRCIVVTLTVWWQILGWLAAFSLDKALVVLASEKDGEVRPDDALRAVRPPVLILSGIAVLVSFLLGRRFF